MTCNYKDVAAQNQKTDVCNHLGNRGEVELVKTFISIDEFINKHKKYVPTA